MSRRRTVLAQGELRALGIAYGAHARVLRVEEGSDDRGSELDSPSYCGIGIGDGERDGPRGAGGR